MWSCWTPQKKAIVFPRSKWHGKLWCNNVQPAIAQARFRHIHPHVNMNPGRVSLCTKGEKSYHQTTFGGWEDSNLIKSLVESQRPRPRFLQRKWWWAQDCSWQHLVDDSKKVGSRGAQWSRTWEGIVLHDFLVCFLVDFFTDRTKGFIAIFFKPPFGITSFWFTCSTHHGPNPSESMLQNFRHADHVPPSTIQALSFLSRAGFQWRFVGFFRWSWEKKRIRLPVSWC